MVFCLRHVGITDWVRETLKKSVKTLARRSAYALTTHPGNLKECLKVLLTSVTESVITQSFRTAGALMHGSVLLASKRV